MTLAIVLDKKRVTTTGENKDRFHVKIRLTKKLADKRWIQKYYLTGVFATVAEFKKITGNPGKSKELQDKQTTLNDMYEKGKAILRANPFIDPDRFGEQLTSKGDFKDPLAFMLAYSEEMEREGRVGNAHFYRSAHRSFTKFSGGSLAFGQVTSKMLMDYERAMLDAGGSITTVGMYCIAMRRIFNLAINKKIISPDLYPFKGNECYVIPAKKGRKMALTEEQKNVLLRYNKTLNPKILKALDMWRFSYFCNGMNFADIARLRYKDIQQDTLIFDRAKTSRTQRNKEPIVVVIREEVRVIIDRWKGDLSGPGDYIFPILRDGLTPRQIKERIKDFIDATNENLAVACADMGLPKITTYWARHTCATMMKKKGATMEQIREALGHADPKTTEAYLDSFDMETKRKISNML
jgi:integrase/recombinase XerD